MRQTSRSPGRRPPAAGASSGKSGSAFVVFVVAALLVLSAVVITRVLRKPASSLTGPAGSEPAQEAPAVAIPTEPDPSAATAAAPGRDISPTPARIAARNEMPPGASPEAAASPASAGQLVASLTQLNLSQGRLTAQQGQQIKQRLQQLAAQGAAAVPAIREFLEKNQDLSFGEDGAKLAGVPSLRGGLLEALRQIGGPDALAVSRQVLQATADPLEIALAARNLDEGIPGEYRQDIVQSAREALAKVSDGKLETKDATLLFQVLQTYGDATVAPDLEGLARNWNYYAVMTLAGLPSRDGIPSLIKVAQDPAGLQTGNNKFALEMLAQLASQYPEAATALVDLASRNQITDRAWRSVAEGLGGNQYQFARQLPQNTLPSEGVLEVGQSCSGVASQTFYSRPLQESGSAPDLAQRLALIDQLLAANPNNPSAIAALGQARARLTGTGGGK